MKKLLILMLVFSLSSVASATTVDVYIDPAAPGGSVETALLPSEVARVYVTVNTTGLPGSPLNLGNLDAVITVVGPGTILSAIGLVDLPAGTTTWGAQVNWFMGPPPAPPNVFLGGWQAPWSFMPIFGPGNQVEIGMGQMGGQVYATSYPPMIPLPPDGVTHFAWWYEGAVGYVDIHCDELVNLTVSIADGVIFGAAGSMMDDGMTKPVFGAVPITVYQVPEPATIALLGLGGLALLRRRK